jgi:hypothetical protein
MTSRPSLVALAALVLVLAGCAPSAPAPTAAPEPTVTVSPEPTVTVTPEPTETAALILGLDDVSVLDETGGTTTAALDDPQAVLDLVGGVLGAAPAPESTPFGNKYKWPDGVTVTVRGPFSFVRFDVAEAAGYELRTSDGISVGSPRADVDALAPFVEDYDGDGNGQPDIVGLEPREEPGTDSLSSPGEVGTSYIAVLFSGDIVTAMRSPAGDWRDV